MQYIRSKWRLEKAERKEVKTSGSSYALPGQSVHQVRIRAADNGNVIMSVKVIEGDTDMEFNNVYLSLLPGTGEAGTGTFLFTGLMIIVLSISLFVLKKRRIA